MVESASSGDVPRRPVLGVSICVWHAGRVLLIQRGHPPAAGKWAPVGGKVEWGETLADAARREVREEAGIEIDGLTFSQFREILASGPDGVPAFHVVLAVFGARWQSGDAIAGDDAIDVRWASPEQLPSSDLVDGTAHYIMATQALVGPDGSSGREGTG